MWEFLLAVPVILYSYAVGRRLYSWYFLKQTTLPEHYKAINFVSVIIPVRNEAENIQSLLLDLSEQNFPADLMEIIVVDDHSEDASTQIVQDFIQAHPNLDIKLLKLRDKTLATGKKGAIEVGIDQAKGELLVFTDGDCRVHKNWIALQEYAFRENEAVCVCGPVSFVNTDTVFSKLQLIEFSSLIGIGAASIALNAPNMCNGANIGYRKSAFLKVDGFKGNEHIASGDDEFVMHKLHESYPGKIVFLKAKEAIVFTISQKSFYSFVQQRVRWASKWKAYTSKRIKFLAITVFAANLALPACLLLFSLGTVSFFYLFGLILLKFVIDFLFLYPVLAFFDKKQFAWYSIPLQLVYVPYVLFTALKGLKGKYSWKGRTITST